MSMLVRLLLAAFAAVQVFPADWTPVPGRISTRWAKEVTPDTAWPEYPRPQLVRDRSTLR